MTYTVKGEKATVKLNQEEVELLIASLELTNADHQLLEVFKLFHAWEYAESE